MKVFGKLLICTGVAVIFALVAVSHAYAGPAEQKINSRIKSLQRQIDSGASSGKLTPEETSAVQSKLDRIKARVDKAKDAKYGLSGGEVQAINNQIDSLAKDVDKKKHDVKTTRTDTQVTHRIDELQKRIDSGHSNGSLTGSEAKSLATRLENIRKQYERASKNSLSESEIKSIDRKLEQLARDISKEKHDKQRAR